MTLPAIIFGGLLSTFYGAAFHVIRGGGFGRLIVYIVLSWIGFWIGQFIAERFNWNIISVGTLHLGIATLTSLIFMLIGYWLFLGKATKE